MSINREMDKEDVAHILTGILLGHKNGIMPFAATWMDTEIVILSEVGQTEKEKYRMTSLTCGIEKEMIQVNLLTKQKEIHRLRE